MVNIHNGKQTEDNFILFPFFLCYFLHLANIYPRALEKFLASRIQEGKKLTSQERKKYICQIDKKNKIGLWLSSFLSLLLSIYTKNYFYEMALYIYQHGAWLNNPHLLLWWGHVEIEGCRVLYKTEESITASPIILVWSADENRSS